MTILAAYVLTATVLTYLCLDTAECRRDQIANRNAIASDDEQSRSVDLAEFHFLPHANGDKL